MNSTRNAPELRIFPGLWKGRWEVLHNCGRARELGPGPARPGHYLSPATGSSSRATSEAGRRSP